MDPGIIKKKTLALYSQLPMDEEGRSSRWDIRDEIFQLNFQFFHRVTQHTYLDHNRYAYEDRFQEVCCQFLEIWWWYLYPPRYKTEASFTSYFHIRLKERAERSLNELSYSMYRSTLVKCQKLLGLTHWTQVKPDLVTKIEGNSELVQLAMRFFNRNYYVPIEDAKHLESPFASTSICSLYQHPADIIELLMSEMIKRESQLTETDLEEISDMYTIPIGELSTQVQDARIALYNRLRDSVQD